MKLEWKLYDEEEEEDEDDREEENEMERRCSEDPTICKNGDPSHAVARSCCRFWSNKTASQARFAPLSGRPEQGFREHVNRGGQVWSPQKRQRERPHALIPPRQRSNCCSPNDDVISI
ncbi:hypothetical protein TASIC1_0007052500 [Trichoderma asperellum]|uniref:Uncharacterized protein n=1 Tax=Trichoderma asperellum TaxID=101201 RepID=A0A6V8R346_TRIAP|nr:hypothetical protein TASIC1_0007052500 [Trichoderma asperellum]